MDAIVCFSCDQPINLDDGNPITDEQKLVCGSCLDVYLQDGLTKDMQTRLSREETMMPDERTEAQWRIEIKRNTAVELIQEMSDADFETWFDEREPEMSDLATRRIGDG